MTKRKKRTLISLAVFVGLLVAAVFYFRDNADLEQIEKDQEISAEKAADDLADDLNASF